MHDRITDGLFFTMPGPLPRGRHELARQQVHTAHRERLMISATEIMARDGYRGVGIREVCTRAGVSRAAFYECYPDKDACLFAAYDRFIAVLLERLAAVDTRGRDLAANVTAFVEVYLATLQRDLVVARAFQVEMDALGRHARRRRREGLTTMAVVLREQRDLWSPASRDRHPLSVYLGAIYAVRQLASDALDADTEPDLPAIGPEVSTWVQKMVSDPPGEYRPFAG